VGFSRLAAAPEIATVAASRPVQSRAIALNEAATCEGRRGHAACPYRVDDFARIAGLVRISRRGDVALAGVPTLAISTFDGSWLLQVGAHLLHHGPKAAWVSWLYERPASLFSRYEARINTPDRRVGLILRID
jgi:hypothetical protein